MNNMQSAKYKLYTTAIAAMMAASAPSLAQLPGLPTTQPAADSDTVAATQPEARPSTVPQAGPVHGSLFKRATVAAAVEVNAAGPEAQGRTEPSISFTSVSTPAAKRYKKNDIITVVVREDSDSVTNGKGQSDKTQDFDLAIQQFLQLALSGSGVPTVGTVNNPSSLPEIKFKYDNNRQTTGDQERTDSLSIRISATVLDVKPNGTMEIEATKHISVDKEQQTMRLSGICRVEDVAADNTILSTQLADLAVSKQTTGEVHDANRGGWLNQWLDKWNPF